MWDRKVNKIVRKGTTLSNKAFGAPFISHSVHLKSHKASADYLLPAGRSADQLIGKYQQIFKKLNFSE